MLKIELLIFNLEIRPLSSQRISATGELRMRHDVRLGEIEENREHY